MGMPGGGLGGRLTTVSSLLHSRTACSLEFSCGGQAGVGGCGQVWESPGQLAQPPPHSTGEETEGESSRCWPRVPVIRAESRARRGPGSFVPRGPHPLRASPQPSLGAREAPWAN